MSLIRPIFLLVILLFPALSSAEQVYINDTLRVGVRPSPSGSVAPIAVVTTGMRLKVIDRVEGYLKIRSKEGVEGWIKEIYVVDEAPSIIKLHALQAKHQATLEELKRLKSDLQVAAETTQVLSDQLAEQKADKSKLQLQLARQMGMERMEETQHTILWWISLFVIPGLAFAAFYGGVVWYRSQAMKRLGGLRV
jgi:SH3-like domain-containing protein